jgi:hypothetical protein
MASSMADSAAPLRWPIFHSPEADCRPAGTSSLQMVLRRAKLIIFINIPALDEQAIYFHRHSGFRRIPEIEVTCYQ